MTAIETTLPQPDVHAWEHRTTVLTVGVDGDAVFAAVVAEPPSCLVDVDTESEL